MEIANLERERKTFANRLVVVSALLGLSIATNLVLSFQVMNASRIVLVPTLPASVALDVNGRVSKQYLEQLSLDMAWLFCNRTTNTANYLETQAQGLIDPTVYEGIRLQLSKESRAALDNHQTQSFSASDIYVDPNALYSEVRGQLLITSGNQVLDTQDRVFAMTFSKHGSQVLLLSIKDIDPKDSKGEKLKPAAPGTEG